jgi:hypothetical protein
MDLARLHPLRVAGGIRRRALTLKSWLESPEKLIVQRTFRRLSGRVALPKLSVTISDRLPYVHDGVYHREGDGYVLELSKRAPHWIRDDKTSHLGHAYLYWLMQCPPEVKSMSVTLSDGDFPSGSTFSPSTNRSDVVPIPDPFFFETMAFDPFRRLAEKVNISWADRSDDITWRGTSSGIGTFDPVLGGQQPRQAAQRLELILAARHLPGVDVGLANYRRDELRPELLVQTGVLKQPIDEQSWASRKFAIDVDGQTNTWSNLIIRMLLGCCVLKLDSKYGFRQWYYDRLKPWEHYVPVKADASNLGEQVEWVRSNDAQAAEIAANGQRLAQALTFEAGQREAVELITRYWRG